MRLAHVRLTAHEREELERTASSSKVSASEVKVARLLLLLDEGRTYREIREALGCSFAFASRWKKRFVKERLAGLYTRHRGRIIRFDHGVSEQKILSAMSDRLADGRKRWSTRTLAQELGLSHMTVARAWQKRVMPSQPLGKSTVSEVPAPAASELDLVGLYLKSDLRCAVFREELPESGNGSSLRPLRPGALDLYGLLCAPLPGSGRQSPGRASSRELVALLKELLAHQVNGNRLFVLADRPRLERSRAMGELMAHHPSVELCVMGSGGAWLGGVLRWLGSTKSSRLPESDSALRNLSRRLVSFLQEGGRIGRELKWRHRQAAARPLTVPGRDLQTGELGAP
ncbi:MAG TPA: helix-turn-helix domain-containing protein [Thermoanaerobaculia bacterium]|nr:helix-turn-helix domain-containing protein [Thermoanaerobaculia bacterium]